MNKYLPNVDTSSVRPWLSRLTRQRTFKVALGAALVLLLVFYFEAYRAPSLFPAGEIITISEGATISEIAESFEEQNIVSSSFWLKNFSILFKSDGGVLAGDYFFGKKRNVVSIAWRITNGVFGLDPIRVTLPEGATVSEMASILESRFAKFDPATFQALARNDEGYLFPDTYLFLPNARAVEVFNTMRNNFEVRIAEVLPEIEQFGESLEDVIIMSSLLEEEARTMQSRRTIAGILWKRIEIGMPLQVDAVFLYINGKNTFELTLDDLKVEHPYNTYQNKGLPPGPISNPGLNSIKASITPIKGNYLFYLSDRNNRLYYSETFEEHVRKKNLYLN